MDTLQYFSQLDGIILLVDPLSFEAVGGPAAKSTMRFDEIVSTLVGRAVLEMNPTGGNTIDLPLAVAISKADLPEVRRKVGDVRTGHVDGGRCRQAIADWGGGNALRIIERRFKSVEFFACSPLGREAYECFGESFRGAGLLDPLRWVLTGERFMSAVTGLT